MFNTSITTPPISPNSRPPDSVQRGQGFNDSSNLHFASSAMYTTTTTSSSSTASSSAAVMVAHVSTVSSSATPAQSPRSSPIDSTNTAQDRTRSATTYQPFPVVHTSVPVVSHGSPATNEYNRQFPPLPGTSYQGNTARQSGPASVFQAPLNPPPPTRSVNFSSANLDIAHQPFNNFGQTFPSKASSPPKGKEPVSSTQKKRSAPNPSHHPQNKAPVHPTHTSRTPLVSLCLLLCLVTYRQLQTQFPINLTFNL
eukprot:TRINITY_DN427_c0_g1_i1.p1 TRINITY_DN427_c0_g1~~TRINITY_DN427_c0_g1_i1.p1  ORF type:complete len:254 (-),score=22.83 TRINITY_DN427_c0_g1_i1:478-1239(-)